MTTACAPAPPIVAAGEWAEMVASLANMVDSALSGGVLVGEGLGGEGVFGARAGGWWRHGRHGGRCGGGAR
jgi:hypothetical protein